MGASLSDALAAVSSHLKQTSRFSAKERVELEALHAHCGTRYLQPETIPDQLFYSLRAMHAIDVMVLLPPHSAGGKTAAKDDAVVCLCDAHGALKGLPLNTRAKALLTACGRPRDIRGDVFVGRIAVSNASDRKMHGAPGGETPPQVRNGSATMREGR